jgi:hypothetical protein
MNERSDLLLAVTYLRIVQTVQAAQLVRRYGNRKMRDFRTLTKLHIHTSRPYSLKYNVISVPWVISQRNRGNLFVAVVIIVITGTSALYKPWPSAELFDILPYCRSVRLLLLWISEQLNFYGVRFSASRPTPNLEDQGIPLCLAPTP